MDILRHRPLFTCSVVFMAFCVIAPYLPLYAKWALGGVTLAGVLFFALWGILRRKDGYHSATAILAGILACLAILRSHQCFESDGIRYLREINHTEAQVTGTVTDRRGSGGYFTSYALMLDTVNGQKVKGLALFTCHYTSDLQPGERVDMQATVIPLDEIAGDGYDATALVGDGYVIGLLSEDESLVTVTDRESGGLLVKARNLRRTLAARLNLLTGEHAEGLPSALLLGDKTALSDSLRRDFARAGVSHLLAISGLHMTLLFGLLGGILHLITVHKKIRTILLGAGVLGYLLLLGFPPSATRAAIMLGMVYLSSLSYEQADPLTSLGLAGAIILGSTPYAVSDAGFWMSFLATLGLLTILPLLQGMLKGAPREDRHPLRALLRADLVKLLAAILVGLVAMSFTLFIVASVIGELGILSPVATLLLSPFCAPILLLSLICLPLIGTACGSFLGGIVGLLCRGMISLTAWMAKPSWGVVSLRHPAVIPIAAAMIAVTLLLLVVKLPKRARFVILLPMLLGWMTVGGVLAIGQMNIQDEIHVTYLQPSSVSDALIFVSGNRGFVCDLSNGSLTAMSASAREAKRRGATEFAVFMLTHYHTRTSGALSTFLQRETVRALWMPTPRSAKEYDILLACVEKAEDAGVPIYLYDFGEPLKIFRGGEMTVERADLPRSTQPVLLVSVDVSAKTTGKDRLLYCGSAVFESELNESATELIPLADTVIFGSHGPLFKASYGEQLRFSPNTEIIFSAHADAAARFDPAHLPDSVSLWLGQKRFVLVAE